jgi:hypothetical protein
MIPRTRPARPYSIVCRQIPSECHRSPAIAATTGLVAGMPSSGTRSAPSLQQLEDITIRMSREISASRHVERMLQVPVRASNGHSGPGQPARGFVQCSFK